MLDKNGEPSPETSHTKGLKADENIILPE